MNDDCKEFFSEHAKEATGFIKPYYFQNRDLDDNISKFIKFIGIPIYLNTVFKILPFTYYHSIDIETDKYFILGEISHNLQGKEFFCIKKGSDNIYLIQLSPRKNRVYLVNSNICSFLKSIILYNTTIEKHRYMSKIDLKKLGQDAQILLQKLITIDELNSKNYYYRNYYSQIVESYKD